MSFAKAVLYGNLVKDPVVKSVSGGKTVTTFSIAVNEFTGSGSQPNTSYFDCEAWEGKAETIAKHFHAGKPIIVHARIRMDSWDDAQTGAKRYKHRYVVDSFDFVGGRDEGRNPPAGQSELPLSGSAKAAGALGGGSPAPRPRPTPAPQHDINDEDVPF